MKTTTIILADDHHVVRQGFKALLDNQEDFSVIAEAGDGLEAVKITERLKPDILVADSDDALSSMGLRSQGRLERFRQTQG